MQTLRGKVIKVWRIGRTLPAAAAFLAALTGIQADTIVLKSGATIANVSVTRMTGASAEYRRSDGTLSQIPYEKIKSIAYEPVQPTATQALLRRRMQNATTAGPPSLDSSFKRIADEWNSLEKEHRLATNRLDRLLKEIDGLVTEQSRLKKEDPTGTPEYERNRSPTGKKSLNELLQKRQDAENSVAQIRRKQEQLAARFLDLARQLQIKIEKRPSQGSGTQPGDSDSRRIGSRTPWTGRAWRSALFPGWGHFESERPWAGAFFLAGHLALGIHLLDIRNEYLAARDKRNIAILSGVAAQNARLPNYVLAVSILGHQSQQRMTALRQAHSLTAISMAALYVASIADASFDGGFLSLVWDGQTNGSVKFVWRF